MAETLILNEREIPFEQIRNGSADVFTDFEKNTVGFCRQWLNGQATFSLKTSGSTGEPKTIVLKRQQMLISAQQTIDFFSLSPVDTVLVCLNTAYIAGIMMLVRGLQSGAKIIAVEPSANPLQSVNNTIDFAAVVPYQLSSALQNEATRQKLEKTRAVIVGGANVPYKLEQEVLRTKVNVWATFGMTETVTHFALRRINPNPADRYEVLGENTIGTDDRGCLIVQGPVTKNIQLVTNDKVEILSEKKFKWLGRYDNVINSGGVKLQIEIIEKQTEAIFSELHIDFPFFIGPYPDSKLGELVCLIIEAPIPIERLDEDDWQKRYDRYARPRKIMYMDEFERTPTGKIDRSKTLQNLNFGQ